MLNKKYILLGISVLVGLIFTILIFTSITIIDSRHVGVKVVLGKYQNDELRPGVHFTPIIFTRVIEMLTSTRQMTFGASYTSTYAEEVKKVRPINVPDKNGLNVGIELAVNYKVIPDNAAELLVHYGFSWEDKIVYSPTREVVRNVIGKYQSEEIFRQRTKVSSEIKNAVISAIQKRSKGYILVESVELRAIKLPKLIVEQIKKKQLAYQEAERKKYELQAAEMQQKIDVTKAETEQKKKLIQAETQAQEKIIAAKAEAESKVLKAEAEAKANKLVANSITKNLIIWKQLDIYRDIQKEFNKAVANNKDAKLFLNYPIPENTMPIMKMPSIEK